MHALEEFNDIVRAEEPLAPHTYLKVGGPAEFLVQPRSVGDALDLPFKDETFDVVMASLFFHHLSDDACVKVIEQMWRMAKRRVLVNDLHRHPAAYFSIRALARVFSRSPMFQHDGPLSVLRAFRPRELLQVAARAGVPARVYRSFPFRLVLVAEK